MDNIKTKYRPCLTGEVIQHIIELCVADGSFLSYEAVSTLKPYANKIANGSVTPAVIIGARINNFPQQQFNKQMQSPVDSVDAMIAALNNPQKQVPKYESPAAKQKRLILEAYEANPTLFTDRALWQVLKYKSEDANLPDGELTIFCELDIQYGIYADTPIDTQMLEGATAKAWNDAAKKAVRDGIIKDDVLPDYSNVFSAKKLSSNEDDI